MVATRPGHRWWGAAQSMPHPFRSTVPSMCQLQSELPLLLWGSILPSLAHVPSLDPWAQTPLSNQLAQMSSQAMLSGRCRVGKMPSLPDHHISMALTPCSTGQSGMDSAFLSSQVCLPGKRPGLPLAHGLPPAELRWGRRGRLQWAAAGRTSHCMLGRGDVT